MQKNYFRIIMAAIAVIGTGIILFGTEIWTRSNIYHPDKVTTVYNETTGMNTQSYLVGKMAIYIDKTYRMDMPLFQLFVNGEGIDNNPSYQEIGPGSQELSLNSKDADINPNPFVMRLRIKNLGFEPIDVNAQNFKIRDVHDNLVAPNDAWQNKLAEAGFFSGVGNATQIGPNEERIIWLVYGTKSETLEPGSVHQEYVRINYDSDYDFFATKVEFPFNFTEDTPIGNYTSDYQYMYNIGFFSLLVWLGFCGAVYFRKSKDFEE